MVQCSTRSREYDAWHDITVYREIGDEIVKKTISVCAKIYDREIEFFYKTPGSDQLTPAEWDRVKQKINEEI